MLLTLLNTLLQWEWSELLVCCQADVERARVVSAINGFCLPSLPLSS